MRVVHGDSSLSSAQLQPSSDVAALHRVLCNIAELAHLAPVIRLTDLKSVRKGRSGLIHSVVAAEFPGCRAVAACTKFVRNTSQSQATLCGSHAANPNTDLKMQGCLTKAPVIEAPMQDASCRCRVCATLSQAVCRLCRPNNRSK
jgi:hypothetical protein